MIVAPTTVIRILKNIPIDSNYTHTLYFSDKASQLAYFSSMTKYTLTEQSFQRVTSGVCRVAEPINNLYDCNYIMFQNADFGSKWFYAFIKNVEYVNNQTSEISYEIDVMQTWLSDYTLNQCFVEREHSFSDNIGDNIIPESVDLGEYVTQTGFHTVYNLTDTCVIVAIVDYDGSSNGTKYDNIFGAATLYAFTDDTAGVAGINALIDSYSKSPDSIISMYMCPSAMLGVTPSATGTIISYGGGATRHNVNMNRLTDADTLDGYKPKNKKLYTYPYNFLNISNADGNALALRYEFFESLQPTVQIEGTITQPVICVLRPCNYKNAKNTSSTLFNPVLTESIELRNFPVCSWANDAYQAWIAQNSIPNALSSVFKGVTIAGVAAVNPAMGALSGVQMVSGILSQRYQASIAADTVHGSANNGGANVANNKQQFYYARMSVTHQIAFIIDKYFDMFGYATNIVKQPNINTRPYWNYVKTIDCTVNASIPVDDEKKICNCFNNGITFWHDASQVGNYSLDNSPTS